MRLSRLLACLLSAACGCVSPQAERLRAYNDDGVHLFAAGNYRGARDSFQAALEIAPDDVSLRYNLARSWERMGDTDKAEKMYQECLGRDPNHADCRQSLAVLMVRSGRRPEAEKMIEDWLDREPARADAYALDGWLRHQAGDLPGAQGRLQQALKFDQDNVRALNELALVYESLSRPARALTLYERSLDVQPRQDDVIVRVNRLKRQGVVQPRPDRD